MEQPDRAYVFQPEVEVRCELPFVPRPDLRGAAADEWDELVADLHYAETPEYATGHGIAAEWEVVDGACRVLRTCWIPEAEIEKTVTAPIADVELSMSALGALADGAAARSAVSPLVDHYRSWINDVRRPRLADPEADLKRPRSVPIGIPLALELQRANQTGGPRELV